MNPGQLRTSLRQFLRREGSYGVISRAEERAIYDISDLRMDDMGRSLPGYLSETCTQSAHAPDIGTDLPPILRTITLLYETRTTFLIVLVNESRWTRNEAETLETRIEG
jgi:hypothetical protein